MTNTFMGAGLSTPAPQFAQSPVLPPRPQPVVPPQDQRHTKKFSVTVHRFGTCCGLDYAENFWGDEIRDGYGDLVEYNQDRAREFLQKPQRQNTVIVLRHDQREGLLEALEKGGWRLLHEFFNPNHDTVLYLYFWDCRPDKAPGNPKFNSEKYKIVDYPKRPGLGHDRLVQPKEV